MGHGSTPPWSSCGVCHDSRVMSTREGGNGPHRQKGLHDAVSRNPSIGSHSACQFCKRLHSTSSIRCLRHCGSSGHGWRHKRVRSHRITARGGFSFRAVRPVLGARGDYESAGDVNIHDYKFANFCDVYRSEDEPEFEKRDDQASSSNRLLATTTAMVPTAQMTHEYRDDGMTARCGPVLPIILRRLDAPLDHAAVRDRQCPAPSPGRN